MFKFLRRKKNKKFRPKVDGWRPDPAGNYWAFDKNRFSFDSSLSGDVDLRPYSSPRHNQVTTSTCTAQSLVKALEIKRIIKHGHDKHIDLSVLDLYYGARDLMVPKATHIDMGTYIYLGCDVLRRYGVVRESLHPFDKRNLYLPPPVIATREARLNRINSHFKLLNRGSKLLDDIVLNLRAGNPVVFGTKVGEDWFDYDKGVLGIESKPTGKHAMCIVGYIDGNFVVENSWGTWGVDGFAFVKPEVLTHEWSSDFWVIVEGSEVWFE